MKSWGCLLQISCGMIFKKCKDGFVWLVLSREQALQVWDQEIFELFKLYDDGSEGAVDNREEILTHQGQFGVEMHFTTPEGVEKVFEII